MNMNGTALFEGVTVLFLAQAFGVDLSLVLGIDRILDMARTVPNVTGDLVTSIAVDRWERKDAGEVVPGLPASPVLES